MINTKNWNIINVISFLIKMKNIEIVGINKTSILIRVIRVNAYWELFEEGSVKWNFREKSISWSKGFFECYANFNQNCKQYILFDFEKPFIDFSKLDESDLSCITFTTEKDLKRYKDDNLINDEHIIFAFARSNINVSGIKPIRKKLMDIVNELL